MKSKSNSKPEDREGPGDSIDRVVAALPRPIALVGFGVEGGGTLDFLRAQEARELRVFDHALAPEQGNARCAEYPGVIFHGDGDWSKPLSECRTIFRSPGVRPDLPVLEEARAAGAVVTSATELFLALWPGPVVGVTGTVGKGTASTLIGEALRASGVPSHLGGNIGLNPLSFPWRTEEDVGAHGVAVLELSSFQLMGLRGRKPDVAVVLRTSSEHLDWHKDVEEYREAKRQLLDLGNSAQTVIHCADSVGSREIVSGHKGAVLAVSLNGPVADGVGVEDGRVYRYRGGAGRLPPQSPLPRLDKLAMPGRFNLENAAAAWLAAELLMAELARAELARAELLPAELLPAESLEVSAPGAAALDFETNPALAAIADFPGLPHRLERVGGAGGVTCYNDSYATRPDATLAALLTFEQPLALIMGGSEKHADFSELCEAVCAHGSLRRVVLIGSTAERLADELKSAARRLGQGPPPVVRAHSLEGAFEAGLEALDGAGVLLFSPGCASFDMFSNYKVRGEQFRALAAKPRG